MPSSGGYNIVASPPAALILSMSALQLAGQHPRRLLVQMIIKLEKDWYFRELRDFLVRKQCASRGVCCLEEDRTFNSGGIGNCRVQRKRGGLRVTHDHSTFQIDG
jgi:hypothetical protein